MTGRYPARFGFEFTPIPVAVAKRVGRRVEGAAPPSIYHAELAHLTPSMAEMGMPGSEATIAEALKARGYHTIHIGKWHLGEAPAMRPEAQGFDESLGFMGAAAKYLPDDDPSLVNAPLDYDRLDKVLRIALTDAVQWNGGQRFHPGEYLTDYFARQADNAVKANRDRPFFMYLAFNAPHIPLQAKRQDYDALPMIKGHKGGCMERCSALSIAASGGSRRRSSAKVSTVTRWSS